MKTMLKNCILLLLCSFAVVQVAKAQAPPAAQAPTVVIAPVKVTITGPSRTTEGLDSTPFTVSVDPPTAKVDSYRWYFDEKGTHGTDGSLPGNNPSVTFATPSQKTTIVNKAHWYALPDSQWSDDTGFTCSYSINCEIKVGGKSYTYGGVGGFGFFWMVEVIVDPNTPFPAIVGMPKIGVRTVGGKQQWFVNGMGSLSRTITKVDPGHTPTTSEFYHKIIEVHEQRHVTQFTTPIPGLTVSTLWNPTDLYNTVLANLTSDISQAVLEKQIADAIDARNTQDNNQTNNERPALEDDANKLSNAASPLYLNNKIPFNQIR